MICVTNGQVVTNYSSKQASKRIVENKIINYSIY